MTVDNTLQLKQIRAAAVKAQQLKDNDVWGFLIRGLKEEELQKWLATKPEDTLTREACWRMFKSLDTLEGAIDAAVARALEEANEDAERDG